MNEGKQIIHRAVGVQPREPDSSLNQLGKALRVVSQAKTELDRVLREQYPIGVSIVFVKGTKREGGTVIAHGHDGTVMVQLTENPSKSKRVAAHEIRA